MKKLLALSALALASCGGTTTEKIVYMPATEAPTTKAPQTTKAPVVTQPVVQYSIEDEFIYDIESSYGTIYMSEQTVIEVGYSTCAFLRSGGTADELYASMEGAAISSGGDINFIVAVVASALANLCPDQAWKVA